MHDYDGGTGRWAEQLSFLQANLEEERKKKGGGANKRKAAKKSSKVMVAACSVILDSEMCEYTVTDFVDIQCM